MQLSVPPLHRDAELLRRSAEGFVPSLRRWAALAAKCVRKLHGELIPSVGAPVVLPSQDCSFGKCRLVLGWFLVAALGVQANGADLPALRSLLCQPGVTGHSAHELYLLPVIGLFNSQQCMVQQSRVSFKEKKDGAVYKLYYTFNISEKKVNFFLYIHRTWGKQLIQL